MKFIFMAFYCLSLTACNPEFAVEDTKPADGSAKILNAADSILVRVVPTDSSEKYSVLLSWPRLQDDQKMRLRVGRTVSAFSAGQNEFTHEVAHDQILTYFFDILGPQEEVVSSFTKELKIPRDLVVRTGQNEFLEDTKLSVSRVFLDSVPLTTNGHRVEIITSQLISHSGIIQTFAENAKAPIDTKGLGAGEIIINAESAIGTLKIFMRGQTGGDGAVGALYATRADDGFSAGAGFYLCDSSSLANPVKMQPSAAPAEKHPMGAAKTCYCNEYGKAGTDGAPGLPGRAGHDAMDGGNAGVLKVTVTSAAGFDLQTFSIPGLPGAPGEGGDGQPGGNGGAGNTGAYHGTYPDCSGHPGKSGPAGARGSPGKSALPGKKGSICINLISEKRSECAE